MADGDPTPRILFEDGGVNAAEVRREDEVPVRVELGEAGGRPVKTTLHGRPDNQHDAGRAVVGPEAGVRPGRPAELAADHDNGALARRRLGNALDEARDGASREASISAWVLAWLEWVSKLDQLTL